jgi:ADP-ribosylation factor-like protein 2
MGASLLVLRNKSDVKGAMAVDEIKKVLEMQPPSKTVDAEQQGQALELAKIQTHTWTIMSSSAITGKGLNEGIQWVLEDAKSRLFLF